MRKDDTGREWLWCSACEIKEELLMGEGLSRSCKKCFIRFPEEEARKAEEKVKKV